MQSELFSTARLSGSLFADTDRSRLFALKVYPALARVRAKLEACSCADNGRLAIETGPLAGGKPVAVSGGRTRPSSGGFAPLPCRLEFRLEPAGGR